MMRRAAERRGSTLAEMLAAALILGLLAACAAAAVEGAFFSRRGIVETADAQSLGEDLMELAAWELRLGEDVRLGGNQAELTSANFGAGVRLTLREGRMVFLRGEEVYEALAAPAYGDLQVLELKFTGDGELITVDLTIGTRDGAERWRGEMTIRPLNKMERD